MLGKRRHRSILEFLRNETRREVLGIFFRNLNYQGDVGVGERYFTFQCRFLDCFIRFFLFSLPISFTAFLRPSVPIPPRSPFLLFSSHIRVSLPILRPVSDFFRILGHIRQFLSFLSLFCRGAASLLQDVYQNLTTIKL